MTRFFGAALLPLLVAACKMAPPATPPAPPASVDSLAAAVAEAARRSEQESDSSIRAALAGEAMRDADACLARAPQAAPCLYYRGVALGLAARAHPARAAELLKNMLEALQAAAALEPQYDEAGPERVRALVLIRAPGWPLGPGDAEEGLLAARRAAALKPQYPPNVLALAEALQKTGDNGGAQESFQRAREAAQALPAGADRDEWLAQAERGLRR